MKISVAIPALALVFLAVSCKQDYTPKPRGYFRIEFPEKKYSALESDCPFVFDYPQYGTLEKAVGFPAANCWYNIVFPAYKAKIHLTYKPINNNLAQYIEDIHSIAYKHVIKADDITENTIIDPLNHVYGIVYGISGNTASSINFFVTDSSNHFLSGALYFASVPNADSLKPCLLFFGDDVIHLVKSVKWKL
ncbi:MAG: gliding motility lipoprotein GldD [Bacteroidales bacterium]|nr:gliding motility lipoprotein GldD [Bacteroidales bacterium]